MGRDFHKGFTLIEMMIALVIVAILMQVVAPGFERIIKDNRIKSEVFALRGALNLARSEAMTRRAPVIVCPGDDVNGCTVTDWEDGFIAFVDADSSGTYTVPTAADEDHIIVNRNDASNATIDIHFDSASPNNEVRYSAQGYSQQSNLTFTSATFQVCDDRGLRFARGIVISAIGTARAAVDGDDNEIMNDDQGVDFDCTSP